MGVFFNVRKKDYMAYKLRYISSSTTVRDCGVKNNLLRQVVWMIS